MKTRSLLLYPFVLAASLFLLQPVQADQLLLLGDQPVNGTILRTNERSVLLLTDYGTIDYQVGMIKKITLSPGANPKRVDAGELPDSQALILALNKQAWVTILKQIPATAIDNDILKNVPYISFRCGSDYEVNIYGDLEHPAGIEVGIYPHSRY